MFRCVNCGCKREEHIPDLVNEPAEGEFAGIDTVMPGYTMSILDCMETPWPPDYQKQADELCFGSLCVRDGRGYISPDMEREEVEARSKLATAAGTGSVLIVYDERTGMSHILYLE